MTQGILLSYWNAKAINFKCR